MSGGEVAPGETHTFDVPPGAEVDTIELRALFGVFVVEHCVIVLTFAKFPTR